MRVGGRSDAPQYPSTRHTIGLLVDSPVGNTAIHAVGRGTSNDARGLLALFGGSCAEIHEVYPFIVSAIIVTTLL
jgi:hypothetical protein